MVCCKFLLRLLRWKPVGCPIRHQCFLAVPPSSRLYVEFEWVMTMLMVSTGHLTTVIGSVQRIG